MALVTVNDALAQYNANLGWAGNLASAQLALAAIQFLLVNRARVFDDRGTQLNYESLVTEKAALEKFLGSTVPRAFGRSRVNQAGFCGPGGIQ